MAPRSSPPSVPRTCPSSQTETLPPPHTPPPLLQPLASAPASCLWGCHSSRDLMRVGSQSRCPSVSGSLCSLSVSSSVTCHGCPHLPQSSTRVVCPAWPCHPVRSFSPHWSDATLRSPDVRPYTSPRPLGLQVFSLWLAGPHLSAGQAYKSWELSSLWA